MLARWPLNVNLQIFSPINFQTNAFKQFSLLRLNSTTNETYTSNSKLKISLVTRTITLVIKKFPVYILYNNPTQIVSFKQKDWKYFQMNNKIKQILTSNSFMPHMGKCLPASTACDPLQNKNKTYDYVYSLRW